MTVQSISKFLDKFILCLLVLSVLIFRYLGFTSRINLILIVLFSLSILLNIYSYITDGLLICFILILLYLYYNKQKIGGSNDILINNAIQIIPSLLTMLYMFHLLKYRKHYIAKFLTRNIWFFNVYLYISIPFIILQANGMYSLAGVANGQINNLGVDMISGLFGFNGTPVLALFVAFTMILNYAYYTSFCRSNQRSLFLFMTLPLFIFYSILPLFNDNKTYYFILLMFLFIYVIFVCYGKTTTNTLFETRLRRIKVSLIIFSLFIISFILLMQIKPFKETTDTLLREVQNGWKYGSLYQGSNERIGMIQYGLSQPKYLLMGHGVGTHTWTEQGLFGFRHYGQSDLGTFLCLGGLIFIFLLFASIYIFSNNCINSIFLKVVIILFFIILSIYTQVFTVMSLTISVMFEICLCVIGYTHTRERTQLE